MVWPKLAAQSVAIAAGARAGIRLPAGGQDDAGTRSSCVDSSTTSNDSSGLAKIEDGSSRTRVAPLRCKRRSRASSTSSRLVADRKDFAGFFDLGGDAFGLEERDGLLDRERGECGVEEFALRTIRLDDAAIVAVVGDVAARAARHEDLHARLAILFKSKTCAGPARPRGWPPSARLRRPTTITSQLAWFTDPSLVGVISVIRRPLTPLRFVPRL